MDYAFYSNQAQAQAAFPPQQFNGYSLPTTQYTPISTAQQGQPVYQNGHNYQQFPPTYQFQTNGSHVSSRSEQQPSSAPHQPLDESVPRQPNGQHTNGDFRRESQEQDEARSSDEEKESLSPAQNRRKEQNRAAQRAFRERKERHVKDLQSQLQTLSNQSSALATHNELLTRELQRLRTQNEILRATSSSASGVGSGNIRPPTPVHGPQTFSPIDFQDAVGEGAHPLSFEDFGGPYGQRLLAVGRAWDLIMNHPAYQRGQVDMMTVQDRLKGLTQCDGRGPAFREQDVLRAIEESSMGSGDGLL